MAGAGYKTFNTGDILTASDVQTYLQDQVVTNFATTTARDAAITSPTEGQVAFIKADDSFTWYTGSAWKVLTYGTNIAYTPTLTNFSNSGGVTSGFYTRIGDFCICNISITLGAAFAITGALQISLPIAWAATARVNFTGRGNPAGTSYVLTGTAVTSTQNIQLYAQGSSGAYVTYNATSATVPNTWAVGNSINLQVIYEV